MADPIADFMAAMLFTLKNPKAVEKLRSEIEEHALSKADAESAIQQAKSDRFAIQEQVDKLVQAKKDHNLELARIEHGKAELSQRESDLKAREAAVHAASVNMAARASDLAARESAVQQWESRSRAMEAVAEKIKAEFEEKLAKLRQIV